MPKEVITREILLTITITILMCLHRIMEEEMVHSLTGKVIRITIAMCGPKHLPNTKVVELQETDHPSLNRNKDNSKWRTLQKKNSTGNQHGPKECPICQRIVHTEVQLISQKGGLLLILQSRMLEKFHIKRSNQTHSQKQRIMTLILKCWMRVIQRLKTKSSNSSSQSYMSYLT